MSRKAVVDPIYHQYKSQIDAITKLMDHKYQKAARIIGWLYGGSPETWRKLLSSKKKSTTTPKEVKELFKKLAK